MLFFMRVSTDKQKLILVKITPRTSKHPHMTKHNLSHDTMVNQEQSRMSHGTKLDDKPYMTI